MHTTLEIVKCEKKLMKGKIPIDIYQHPHLQHYSSGGEGWLTRQKRARVKYVWLNTGFEYDSEEVRVKWDSGEERVRCV